MSLLIIILPGELISVTIIFFNFLLLKHPQSKIHSFEILLYAKKMIVFCAKN